MLDFRPLTLEDAQWGRRVYRAENSPSADHNFANVYCWQWGYRTSIARLGERALVRIDYGKSPIFAYPVGSGPLRPAVEALKGCADELGVPFIIRGVTETQLARLEDEFPDCFEYIREENSFDYIYLAEKLASYSGKALHAKKNHCNRFEAENDWRFVPLTRELFPACREMLERWKRDNAGRLDESISFEYRVIEAGLDGFEALALEGGALYSGGRLIGFTYGDMTTADTLDVHVEKADASINGAYPMVCREFVRMMLERHPGLKFVNREDDMGLDYLRQSKRSYKPEMLLIKYRARWKDGKALHP